MIIIFFLLNYLTSHVVTLENEQRKRGTISINMYPAERSPRRKKKKKRERMIYFLKHVSLFFPPKTPTYYNTHNTLQL